MTLNTIEVESWAVCAVLDSLDQQLTDAQRDQAAKKYEQHVLWLAHNLRIDQLAQGLTEAKQIGDPWRSRLYYDAAQHWHQCSNSTLGVLAHG